MSAMCSANVCIPAVTQDISFAIALLFLLEIQRYASYYETVDNLFLLKVTGEGKVRLVFSVEVRESLQHWFYQLPTNLFIII